MTTTLRSPTVVPRDGRDAHRRVVVVSALAAAGSRLPFLSRPPGPDEGGFLLVGGQWHAGSGSLYGSYWVDRPPLLIAVYRWAAQTGGLVSLRLVGCLAVVLVVVLSAYLARRIAGPRAGCWAAVAATAFLVSPLSGSREVNGELLAAPLVLVGMSAALTALMAPNRTRVILAAAGAGAAAVAALLVKQNFADVAVFGVVLGATMLWRGEVDRSRLRHVVPAATAGGGLVAVVVGGWAVLHGTSLTGVVDAMYPFRVAASRTMAEHGGAHAVIRMHRLFAAWVFTGLGLVSALAGWALVTRRVRDGVVWALAATIAFEGVSIALGGNFWLHYLVQLVGPVSVVTGVLVARRVRGSREVVIAAGVLAVGLWSVSLSLDPAANGATVGRTVAASSRAGDTIVTAYGQPDVAETAGLSSPYPYLWSLPVKTLDPHLTRLDAVLRGPAAPTWLVVWKNIDSWGLDAAETRAILAAAYHPAGRVCGHEVYLRDGLDRPALADPICSKGASTIGGALERHLL
ncbi:glycosyltransferase family 39 protein [Aeromicrobium terrae]|uniref:Uncharacterized protein n=1 Tax=Aeromicrobium terrae TaxID=2498846 RepID=A0A5C8NM59_9ACTN|nr:glycosyltransferase family 39 protein [Aeromicrobium terrae]TXL62934.1 hypothetical protein FHP06_01460 [Aeromicrobium terrae]